MISQVKTATLDITSPAFSHNGLIPAKHTCEGENINPSLEVTGIPDEAKSLVLIVEDPDARHGIWDHWIVWNIPAKGTVVENTVPGIEGINSFKHHKYDGPCPPSGTHRYFFKVYALDTMLDLPSDSDKKKLEKAMEDHVLARGEIIGLYKKRQE